MRNKGQRTFELVTKEGTPVTEVRGGKGEAVREANRLTVQTGRKVYVGEGKYKK